MTILLERLLHLYRAKTDTQTFLGQIKQLLQNNNMSQALDLCAKTAGPIASIFKAGLVKIDRSKEEISEALHDAGNQEIPRLERNLSMLATIAHITPLLGLLGTVSGMISAFKMIQEKTGVGLAINPGDLAGGIWEALLTTAAGLVVAIPTYVAYNYLVTRVNHMVVEMEDASSKMVDILVVGSSDEI